MSERVDWYNLIAGERGMPAGWMWYSARAINGGFLLIGAVCTATFQRGPRKGSINWTKRDRSTEREILISQADLEAQQTKWERETGKCRKCFGTAQEWAGWSAKTGTIFKLCRRCGATGNAQTS